MVAERTERARFGRRRPAFGHAEDDDGENQDQRRDGDEQIEPGPLELGSPSSSDTAPALGLIQQRSMHIGDEQGRQDQSRHDAADQQAR